MAKRNPEPVDVQVGANIRIFRLAKGLSQTALADATGVTFQQVQKYESGTNRVSSSRLVKISKVLEVPVAQFFDQDGGKEETIASETAASLLSQPLAVRLLRAFARVPNKRTRLSVVNFVEALAGARKR